MSRCVITCMKNEKRRIGAFCEVICCWTPFILPSFLSLLRFLTLCLPLCLLVLFFYFISSSLYFTSPSFSSFSQSQFPSIVSFLFFNNPFLSSSLLPPSPPPFSPILFISLLKWFASSPHSFYFLHVSYGYRTNHIGYI